MKKKAYEYLKMARPWMTILQRKTIQGQIRAGDYEGAIKGINKIMRREQ